jgi:hypothetical protein
LHAGRSRGACVAANFGEEPFRFNLEGMLAEEQDAQAAAVQQCAAPYQLNISTHVSALLTCKAFRCLLHTMRLVFRAPLGHGSLLLDRL